jgi:type I restriction enzyme S subunit
MSEVTLGQLLRPIERPEPVDPSRLYRLLGVRWYGEGLFEKESKMGQEIQAQRLYKIHEGDFVYNRLFAWKGSFAVADRNNDGCYVSNEFPCFQVNEERLDVRFLRWWFHQELAWSKALGLSQGATPTSRNRLKEEHFLSMKITLPPLGEQRRVVALIEELLAKINEARSLREQTTEEAEALLRSQCHKVFSALERKHQPREFSSFHPHVTSGPRDWGKHYAKDGYRFYRAQDIGPTGQILDDSKIFIVPPPGGQGRSAMPQIGDLLLVITGATVGRVNVYGEGLEPGFVSQHVAICRLPAEEVNPQFALWGLRAPQGQAQLLGQQYGQGKPGLNLSNIRSLRLPFPTLQEQQKIVETLDALQSQVDGLKRLHSESSAELEAMLPAILARAFKGEM